jgi:hypothetical protein
MQPEIPQNIAGNACFRSSSRLEIQMLKQIYVGELSRFGAVDVLQHKKYSRAGKMARDGAGRARSSGGWRAIPVRLCLSRFSRAFVHWLRTRCRQAYRHAYPQAGAWEFTISPAAPPGAPDAYF